ARAASAALLPSRDAIAATGVSPPSCIAGVILWRAKWDAPGTAERNMSAHPNLCPRPPGRGKSDDGAVLDDAVLRDDDDAFADEPAVAVGVLGLRLVEDADAAADARVLVDDRVLDDRVGPDADRRDALRLAGVHLVQRLVEVGADEQAVA